MAMNYSLSVVIPVYNSEMTLEELVVCLHPVLKSFVGGYELILVNDGSRDASWRVVCDLVSRYPWIEGINLMRNYGQHNALLCGIRAATYDVVVTMDDDLQNPPEEIPKLVDKLAEGFDVVYGMPREEQHGLWRDMGSRITKMVLKHAMGADAARHASAFRAFRTQVRQAFSGYQSPYVSIDVLLSWGTTRFTAIPVLHRPRSRGVSGYTFRKLLTHAINMMTGFSTLPLQIASIVGFVFTIFGAGVLVYVVGRYFIEGSSVAGFPFLASIIAIFSGSQMFAIGVIGEYLARMHFRSMGRPYCCVRETVTYTGQETNVNGL